MIGGLVSGLGQKALFCLDAETAHGLAIRALRTGLVRPPKVPDNPGLAVRSLGLTFPNPLGMAAGFDKNAEVPDALLALGFGFVEVGTITPRPQFGNPRPRIFRLPEARAVINRLGFNNEGHDAAARRLLARRGRPGIVGINIGTNKDATDRIADYVAGIRRFHQDAGYFTVNISSPNTPGLRALQARGALDDLLARVVAARDAAASAGGRPVPVLVKIAPDMDEAGLDDVAAVALGRGIDGLIVSNTTLARAGVGRLPIAAEAGGLSGRPLLERSTIVLARMRQRLGPVPVLIGVGGISSGADAISKIAAGADLVQLYTGLVYEGLDLPRRILTDIVAHLDATGAKDVAALRDIATDDYARRPIPT